MAYYTMPILDEKGFVILKQAAKLVDAREWESLAYMDWKSGGDTNFAPIASAYGVMECHGFWDHGKPDKDGVWTTNAATCPSLVKWAEAPGVRFGRVRTIKLEPNTYEEAIRNLHRDDNNRLNPDGEGWVVRSWLQLTDDPDSYMIVREVKDDPSTESHIPLPAGAQFVVDSERLQHAVFHPGPKPRYALIVSWESAPELERWIDSQLPALRAQSDGGSIRVVADHGARAGLALRLTGRVYILGENGRIAWRGRPAGLEADPQVKRRHPGVRPGVNVGCERAASKEDVTWRRSASSAWARWGRRW